MTPRSYVPTRSRLAFGRATQDLGLAERTEADMRQANWSEYIQSHTVVTIPDKRPPVQFRAPALLKDWESWLTFGLVLMVYLSVARSIEEADWVPGMPSLVGLSFMALTI